MGESVEEPQSIPKYQSILKTNGLGHKQITHVFVTKPNLLGQHMGSICKYVTLKFQEEGKEDKLELFVKELPANTEEILNHGLDKENDTFTRESEFFNVVLKDLQNYYVEKSGTSKPMDFFPKCFYADRHEIIMENLVRNHGYYLNSKVERQDLEHATMTLENLATYHAVGYSMITEMGKCLALKKYKTLHDEVMFSNKNSMLQMMMKNTMKSALALLNNHNLAGASQAIQLINKLGTNQWENLVHVATKEPSDFVNVIGHGDCWNNNMMFLRDSDTGKLKHQVIVDFPGARITSPNIDLNYYIYTSIQAGVRATHLKSLLQVYFTKFSTTIETLTKSNFPYTFQEFLTDFKEKSLVGFWMCLLFVFAMDVLPNIDPVKLKDLASAFDTVIIDWSQANPEQAKQVTITMIEFCNEYENFMKQI